MIIAGQQKRIQGALFNAANNERITTATVFCIITLESGDADDLKYWDGDSWEDVLGTIPEAQTDIFELEWYYDLSGAATTGKIGATIHYTFLHDEIASWCFGAEHSIRAEDPLTTADLSSTETAIRGTDGDDLKDLSDQLDQIAAPAGLRQVTIHIKDNGEAPVPGVSVAVYDESNTTMITRGTTDSGGDLVVALDDDTYKVRLSKARWSFTVPETLVVTADQTTDFEGTAFEPSAPSSPDNCVMYDWVVTGDGVAVVGATVVAVPSVPQVVDGSHVTGERVSTVTDGDGYFEIEVLRGSEMRIMIQAAGYDRTGTIPVAASQDLSDWSA